MSLPKSPKGTLALLGLLASIVAGTAGVLTYVRAMADEKVQAAVAPIKAETEVWRRGTERRLERIEHKIDQLLERKQQ